MARQFLVPITLPADPSGALEAATKQYVDGRTPTDAAAGTGSLRTLGTGSAQAAAGNDSRLTDSRTPTAHAASHAAGGSDAVTPAAIGAMARLTPTATKTTTYTAASGELVMCDTTSGAFTVTLPAAAAGAVVGIKKTITASGTLTIARAGSDTIGGAAATSIQLKLPDETVLLIANGTNWVVWSNYMPLPSLDGRFVRSDGASTAAGGSLAGFYPNPTIGAGVITGTEIASAIKDPVAATAGLRTLGTGSAQAAAGDDSRITGAAQKASNLSDLASAATARSNLGVAQRLTPTASKTSAYTAVAGDLVLADATSGGFTVTLPAAATDTIVSVKKTDSSTNVITIARAGSDTIGAAAATSITLVLQDQSVTLVGRSGSWVLLENHLALSTLDSRHALATRLVSAGTGLTGGGDLSADRTLAVAYGSASATAVQGNDARVTADQAAATASIRTIGTGALQACAGNDARLSDARTPTAHNHAGSEITSGTVDNARLPKVLSAVRTVNPSGGTISIDADGAGNNVDSTMTGDATLNVPTNGGAGQVIQGAAYASGAQRTLTFHASLGRLTNIASTLVIASGKVGRYSLRRTDVTGSAKWLVEAVGVEQ